MQSVEITIKGLIDEHCSEWFEGLEISYLSGGEMMLKGQVHDHAELYGLIAKLRDLGLQLVSVHTD